MTLYLRTQTRNIRDLEDSLGTVDKLLSEAVDHPVMFAHQDWIVLTRFWLLDLQTFQRKVDAVIVPPPMQPFHDELMLAAEAYVRFTESIVLGLDSSDADPRLRATQWREEAQIHLNRGLLAMQTACPSNGDG